MKYTEHSDNSSAELKHIFWKVWRYDGSYIVWTNRGSFRLWPPAWFGRKDKP